MQVFHRFEANSPSETIDARFDLFVKEILPQFKETIMNHTMIYIPSYFDFVHIRNYLRQEELSFCQICEYTKVKFKNYPSHFLKYHHRLYICKLNDDKGSYNQTRTAK